MKIQTTLNHSNRLISKPEARPTTQEPTAQLPSETVSISQEKRINWGDIKDLGSLAVGGALMGGTPVLGAGLGLADLAATSTFAGGFSLRGAATLALNVAGTASLFAGYLPGAALGLGGSALMGAGSFVADNLHGKTLTTTEPREKKSEEPSPEFSLGRLGKSATAGVMGAAFTAIPGFGLLVGLNAGDAHHRPGMPKGLPPLLVGGTTIARVGGAIASVATANPVPYMAAVGLNSVVMGIDNAILNYKAD